MNSDDLIGYPTARRVSMIILLVVVILAAIGLGLYVWFGNSSTTKPKTKSTASSHLTAPSPKPKSTTQSQPSVASSGSVGANSAIATSSVSGTQPSQLTNTGPGDSVFVAFIAAVALGTASHYLWRRRVVSRS